MARKYVVALMVAAAFIAASFAVISFLQKGEPVRYDKEYTWYVEIDPATDADLMVRGKRINQIRNDAVKLVAALNSSDKDPESVRTPGDQEPNDPPQVKLMKVENGVAVVEVMNAEFLTQRMGTSGAQDYLASATYTLTENPRIKKVKFIFEEGDHAMPGVYDRESFTSYKVVAGSGK